MPLWRGRVHASLKGEGPCLSGGGGSMPLWRGRVHASLKGEGPCLSGGEVAISL